MRRFFSRDEDDYEHRRRDPRGGDHLRGAAGYGDARDNDPDREPPGGSWANRDVREVRDGRVYHGAAPRDDDRRFQWRDERWHDDDARWRDRQHRAQAPDAGSGFGYGYQQRDERSAMPSRQSGYDYGRYGGSFGAREPLREAWNPDRGPKGYTRSDERIREDICERLHHEPYIDVREVGVQVRDGTVTLEGTVPRRVMKHRIEDICEACSGVREIDDRISVERVGDAVRRAEADAARETSAADRSRESRAQDTQPDPSHIAGSTH